MLSRALKPKKILVKVKPKASRASENSNLSTKNSLG